MLKFVAEKPALPAPQAAHALSARGLAFAYKKGAEDVLFGLDYTAEKGCINAVVGANGSGKTTLLKCLCKILKPYGGKIKMQGRAVYMPQNVQALFFVRYSS